MTVAVASIFRDSMSYIDRYFTQICELEQALDSPVQLVIAEGDSEDSTHNYLYAQIRERGVGDIFLKVDHGGRKFGSVDHPERWAQIATVCNAVMDAVPQPDTTVIYVESDLVWPPDTMVKLLEDLAVVPAVAPLSLRKGSFYDIWGHRGIDGDRFESLPPYHRSLEESDDPLVEIGSAGSCVVMRPEVAEVARFGDNDAIVGLGRDIRYAAKSHLFLDRRVAVFHE